MTLDVANVNGVMNGFFKLWNCKQTVVKRTLGLFLLIHCWERQLCKCMIISGVKNIFSECIFLHINEICIVKLENKVSKTSLKNCCSLRIKLSSIPYGRTAHVWEEVDVCIEHHPLQSLVSTSRALTKLVGQTCFCKDCASVSRPYIEFSQLVLC